METKNIIIAIVAGLLIVGVGFLGGVLYDNMTTPKVVTPGTNTSAVPSVVKDLSSKVIPSISATGKITNISGRTISINSQGDTLAVAIRQDARIYGFTASVPASPGVKAKPSTSKQITFEELKVGDNISVSLKVLSAGSLEGFSVVVLPVSVPPVAK